MTQPDRRDLENQVLRERLAKLSETSLSINESLDFHTVLQNVLDSARSLTGARYGVIATMDEQGGLEAVLTSGTSDKEHRQLISLPGGTRIFAHFIAIADPQRVDNYGEYAASVGLDGLLPMTIWAGMSVPIRHRGQSVGVIWLGQDREERKFTDEDEDFLVMFSSQAALVIANSCRYREERRVRSRLETLMNTLPVGVAVFDAKTGELASLNQEALRIVDSLMDPGQTPEQLLEVLSYRREDGREMTFAEAPLVTSLGAGETLFAEEIVLEVPDGRSVSILLNTTPVHSEDGEVVESVVVTMQDLAPLEDTERLRAEFLGMVSHELRTPLTSIKGSATTLLDASAELDPIELRQFLRIIVDQADSMRHLIGDLLDVARIETGTLPIGAEPTDVAVLLDRGRNTFLSGGGRDNLLIDLPTNLPLVRVDRRRIVQVLSNLLSNAARNSPESSTIWVCAEQVGIHIAISIVDEGRGIPAEHLPHLFRKFSRASPEEQGEDAGLGLAICKGIVEAHGGRIWAESEGLGLGAKFTFTIPTVENAVAEQEIDSTLSQDNGEGRYPILAVDDDPQSLRYVRSTLSQAGYTPIVTTSAEEAITIISEREPQLVLMDLMLPGSDGIELMKDIFGIADVPVIFLSAYGRDQVIARAFEEGAYDYIMKPFSPAELVARVNSALRRFNGGGRTEPEEPYVFRDLYIDYTERSVSVAGRQLQLTATEYKILYELSINRGRTLTHDQILRRVWGRDKPHDLQSLRAHLRRIRRKIGEDGSNPIYILSEPRVGYRMPKSSGGEPEEEVGENNSQ